MRRFASLFGRRGVLAAAAVALSVIAVLVVQDLVMALSSTLVGWGMYEQAPGGYLGYIWADFGWSAVSINLPFALGVFASLWLIAPVAAELRLAHVVTRTVLAAGVGASLALIVSGIQPLVWALSGMNSLFGNSFPPIPWERVMSSLSQAVQMAVGSFVQLVPLVVLAGIFLWLWLQKHPSRHAVSGMLDEV